MTAEELRLLAIGFLLGAACGILWCWFVMTRAEKRRIRSYETIYERAVRKANDETKD